MPSEFTQPFLHCRNAAEIVCSLLVSHSKDTAAEYVRERIKEFNRNMDIFGYTPNDVSKMKMMRESINLLIN